MLHVLKQEVVGRFLPAMNGYAGEPSEQAWRSAFSILWNTWGLMATVSALADDALRSRGVAVLEEHLGPVQALRFLALLCREPFDYQAWRDKHFAGLDLEEILGSPRPSARKR